MEEDFKLGKKEWQQFVSTGRILDYLQYKACLENNSCDRERLGSQQGVNPYAGINHCNRNHIEADAYRRL